ncbi:MAG: transposase [Myxococcota bacterium]
MTQLEDRVKELDGLLGQLAEESTYREPVAHLRCFRGIDTLTAITLVTELHGFGRFLSPRALMADLGLVPSEFSSGPRQRRGGITKTGHHFVRRVLVKAAHHCGKAPQVGTLVGKRRRGQSASVVAIAERAQYRLYRRYWRLISAGKDRNMVIVAVARELVGLIWAVLNQPSEGMEEHPATAQGG